MIFDSGLSEGFEVFSNIQTNDILNCFKCSFKKCSEEYIEKNNCFPKEKNNSVGTSSPPPSDSSVYCKIGNHTRAKELLCYAGDVGTTKIDCHKPLPVKTLVKYSCPPFYQSSHMMTSSFCERDGTWSEPIKCIPECGKSFTIKPLTPLILGGRKVQTRSQWPWAAALYQLRRNSYYSYFCGATLIGDNLLVTAAHCTYSSLTKSSNLLVVFDEFTREIPKNRADLHGYKVKRAYRLPVFKLDKNGFNSDISILVLESQVKLSEHLIPACLPSTNITIKPSTQAIVAGWGYPNLKEEKISKNLLYMKVPLVDTLHCSKVLPLNLVKLLAFTTFCAGYRNGTKACKGDTGSGLLTMNPEGLWELQGVVSIIPQYKGSLTKNQLSPCHPRMFSLYTKVYLFLEWIEKIVKFEEMGSPVKTKQHN